MSFLDSSGDGSRLRSASPSAPASNFDTSRKRSRANQNTSRFGDDDDDGDGYGSSINPLFLVSGPRGGAISARAAAAQLASLVDVVDDGVYDVLRRAWAAVAVPSDTYWGSASHLPTIGDSSALLLRRSGTAGDAVNAARAGVAGGSAASRRVVLGPRLPDPRRLLSSFYPTRVEALAARGYQPHRGLVPVALDRQGGKGCKMFNVLPRWECETGTARVVEATTAAATAPVGAESGASDRGQHRKGSDVLRSSGVARFVGAIPCPTDRNLYALVDENCPVDPYFDVDLSFDPAGDDLRTKLPFLQALRDSRDGLAASYAPAATAHPTTEAPIHLNNQTATALPVSPTPATEATTNTTVGVLEAHEVENALLTILRALREEVETCWHTPVEECLVLTSSLQLAHHDGRAVHGTVVELLKISFHVHFRLGNHAAVESVRELHAFMTALRLRLQQTQLESEGVQDESNGAQERAAAAARRATLLLNCLDFGVYTRWRAFRLPYNVKAPESSRHQTHNHPHSTAAKPLANGAGDDLMLEQLSACGISVPRVEVGSVAPQVLQTIVYAAEEEAQWRQRYLMEKLRLYFRFLLPIVPGATHFTVAGLEKFLKELTPTALTGPQSTAAMPAASSTPLAKDVLGSWAMEMSCIARDASAPHAAAPHAVTEGGGAEEKEETEVNAFTLLQYRSPAAEAAATAATASANASPFDFPMPPMPRSMRVRVDDKAIKKLLAEVFWCLGPEYAPSSWATEAAVRAATADGGGTREAPAATAAPVHTPSCVITPERINAQFEESIRAYYVYQKQNKFCYRLQRQHKATYAQLYLTFGSIKVRCYSNDCCDSCCVIPWEAPENPKSAPQFHPGFPKFERLAEIHHALFPPLPPNELVRRYGTAVLQHLGQQQ